MSRVGEALYNERKRQGITINDVAHATNIRSLLLDALEKGDFGHLPKQGYVRGFVVSYATFLKLDVDEMVRLMERDYQYRETEEAALSKSRKTNRAAATTHEIPWKVAVWIFIVIAAVTIIYFASTALSKRESKITPAPLTSSQEEAETQD